MRKFIGIFGILILFVACFTVKEAEADYVDGVQGLRFDNPGTGIPYNDFESQIPDGWRRATLEEVFEMVKNIGFDAGYWRPMEDPYYPYRGDAKAIRNSGLTVYQVSGIGGKKSISGMITHPDPERVDEWAMLIEINDSDDAYWEKMAKEHGTIPWPFDSYSAGTSTPKGSLSNYDCGHWIVTPAPKDPPPEPTGSISGFIIDDLNHYGIYGVRVRLKGQGRSTLSGWGGYYEFTGLAQRNYTVDALNPTGDNPKKKVQVRLKNAWSRDVDVNLIIKE